MRIVQLLKEGTPQIRKEKYEKKMNKLYKKLVRNVSSRDIMHVPITRKKVKPNKLVQFMNCFLANSTNKRTH